MTSTSFLLLVFVNTGIALGLLFISTIKHHESQIKARSGLLFSGFFLWSAFYGVLLSYFSGYLIFGVIGEAIKNVCLLLFVYHLSKGKINHSPGVFHITVAPALLMPMLLLFPIAPQWAVTLYSMAGISYCVGTLLFCERAFHVCTRSDGNRELHLLFGIVFIIGVEFFIYCDSLFSSKLTVEHIKWRMVCVLFALPLIYKGINNLKRTPLKFSLSRPLAFHGSIMVIVGSYLLAISLLSTLSSYFSYQWDHTSKTILFAGLAFPAAYILLSNRIRSEVRVWVNKHLFAGQFDYRRTWLELLDTFDPTLSSEDAVQCGLKAILNVLDHTRGAFFTYNHESGVAKSIGKVNMDISEGAEVEIERILFQMNDSKEHWIVDINELEKTPSAYSMLSCSAPALNEDGVLWLIPVTKNSTIVGAVAIGRENHSHWELSWETRDFLNALTQHLHRYYEAQISQQKLNESAQLLAFSQMSAFVTHDLKNVYAQLNMITKNAEHHQDNPEFVKDVFDDLNGMEKRMKKMLEHLTDKKRDHRKRETETFSVLPIIKSILNNPASKKLNIPPNLVLPREDNVLVYGDAQRFENVLLHLVENAQQACAKKDFPEVTLICKCSQKNVIISVADNGVGMDENFIKERLFKPFDTTKGNSGMGLGVYDAKTFAEDHNGSLTVDSEVNKGTLISLTIPRSGI